MVYLMQKNEILITDLHDKCIYVIDTDGVLINVIKPKDSLNKHILKEPMAITLLNNKNIAIYDRLMGKILIFNEKFEILNEIQGLECADFIIADSSNSSCLYVSEMDLFCNNEKDRIYLYDTESRQIVKQLKIIKPWDLKCYANKLYLTSWSFLRYIDEVERIVHDINVGNNCIYIVDKSTLSIIKTIKLKDFVLPHGLHIDQNQHIWTLAFKLEKNNIRSEYRYLLIIDEDGHILKEFYLNNICWFHDMIVFENKIFICGGLRPSFIKIIEIE